MGVARATSGRRLLERESLSVSNVKSGGCESSVESGGFVSKVEGGGFVINVEGGGFVSNVESGDGRRVYGRC